MSKIAIILGVILLGAAGVWKFGVSNGMTPRFPDGWRYVDDSLSFASNADPSLQGGWPEGSSVRNDPLSLSNRVISASAENAPDGMVDIVDHFQTYDAVSNVQTWEHESTIRVDSRTGQVESGDDNNVYYSFPQNVQKTTYTIYDVAPLTVNYEDEEEIGGLLTYKFSFKGDLDDTESSYVPLEANQRTFCFDYYQAYWVEPTTGEIVQREFWCEGDWVVDTTTNQRLYPISRWGGTSTSDNVIRQTNVVKSELSRQNWITLYIPLLLAIAGAILLVFGILLGPVRNRRGSGVSA